METKTKILIGTLLVLLVIATSVAVFAAPMYNAMAIAQKPTSMSNGQNENENLNLKLLNGELSFKWLFKDAKNVTIEGKIVTYLGRILVVDSEGKKLNIILPKHWSANDENKIYNVTELFDASLIKAGDAVTIKALERDVTNKNGLTISIIAAYEIIGVDNSLHTILPFNVSS